MYDRARSTGLAEAKSALPQGSLLVIQQTQLDHSVVETIGWRTGGRHPIGFSGEGIFDLARLPAMIMIMIIA
jgi:hypothetical protein